jgi:uncharacterized protein YjiS (DUF1127 family)
MSSQNRASALGLWRTRGSRKRALPQVVALRLLRCVRLCLDRWRERQTLAELTDTELRDIGLSRRDVARECARWPWDGPDRR